MLFEAVGGQGVAGRALKTRRNWSDNSGGTNSYGFSALPSGYYREYDGFSYVNHLSNFWTATEGTSYTSYYISLESVGDAANRYDISKGHAFSVRCLKDEVGLFCNSDVCLDLKIHHLVLYQMVYFFERLCFQIQFCR